MPSNEVFDDLDGEGQNLLGSLHLEADDEPTRRGAASRANSVRFDESALQGSSWGGQGGRHSGEFGPARPGSGLGNHAMMERSFSHKSDGRHSSAGHSVHSMHSGVSGRASSLGLDTNFVVGGRGEDYPLDIPEPPPGFFFLGPVPSIIRCWLNTDFCSSTLLYAAVCTGAKTSTVDFSLVKELDLADDIHRDMEGIHRIRLPVYLAEARVTQSNSRSPSPAPQLPSIQASFQVTGIEHTDAAEMSRRVRIFIGSDTLRLHSADILFSQNIMTLYGNDRDKLSVPLVRPEDDAVFKHLSTAHIMPEKPKLNASAPEFVSTDNTSRSDAQSTDPASSQPKNSEIDSQRPLSRTGRQVGQAGKVAPASTASESGAESERQAAESTAPEVPGRDSGRHTGSSRRDSSTAIWGPWRQGASGIGGENGPRENGPLSGYQPAPRVSRGMKILKPSKSSGSSSTKTGAAYEPAPSRRSSGEHRRRSQASASTAETGTGTGTVRWDSKRSISGALGGNASSGGSSKPPTVSHDTVKGSSAPRSASNPLGNASAFASWMGHAGKHKTPTPAAE